MYLTNHGIDEKLLDDALVDIKRFFDLPMEEKMKCLHDKNHRGYTLFAEEILDLVNQKEGEIFSSNRHLREFERAKGDLNILRCRTSTCCKVSKIYA